MMNDLWFVLRLAAGAAVAVALIVAVAGALRLSRRKRDPKDIEQRLIVAVADALRLDGSFARAPKPPRSHTELTVRLTTDDIPYWAIQALADEVRRVVREAHLGFAGAAQSGDNVEVTLRDGVDRQQALARLRELAYPLGSKPGAGAERFAITEAGGARLQLALTEATIADEVARASDRTIDVLKRRLDELGLKPTFTHSGADLIVIRVPAQPDTTSLKHVIVTPGRLQFRLVNTSINPQDALRVVAPSEGEVLYEKMGDQRIPLVVKQQALVDGNDLIDAQVAYDERTNEPIVNFKFNSIGARKFGRATQENVGRPFAIVLDNDVISAPVIREPILSGQGQISGEFTVESANNLAILLRSGALPVPLTIVEERTV